METIIEKRIYEEGRNNAYGGGQWSTRNARNWGIAGTVLGGAALAAQLWRNGGIGAFLNGGGNRGNSTPASDSPANVNINGYGGGGGYSIGYCCSPTPFDVYSKGCEDVVALTNAFWGERVTSLKELIALRNTDVAEKFALYNSQITADFGLYKDNRDNIDGVNNRLNAELFSLYKYTRDKDDETAKELCNLKAEIAVANAVRPYQDKLILCEIDKAFTAAMTALERRTCKMLEGVVTLPTTPTVTGLTSYCCCSNQAAAAAG
jgi:hypothetical protein